MTIYNNLSPKDKKWYEGECKKTVKCLNAAAGYLKKRAVAVARTGPRDDGLAPQRLSALFRFRVRCELQTAIMRGNGLIAAEVGL